MHCISVYGKDDKAVQPQSHRIVRLLDRTNCCDLAKVRPVVRSIVEFCVNNRLVVPQVVRLHDQLHD